MERKRLCKHCNYNVTTETYCDRCKALGYDKKEHKPKKVNPFYKTKYWKSLRSLVLQRDGYICQICKAHGRYIVATEVDHIVPLSQGGTNDIKNLQAICKKCHARKTFEETKGMR